MGKWSLAVCNLIIFCALIVFSGCFAGADYENKMIYVYRSTGPKVLEQFKATLSKKEISPPQATETPDEILFRIIDTEIKRSGQLVYASLSLSTIHAEADKLQKLFPELRITVVHTPFAEWNRSWISVVEKKGKYRPEVIYLDENCCPEEYKAMTEEDFDKIVSDFFAGDYDILLCGGSFYNIHRLSKRNSPIGKPAVIEKLPIRMKSGVKGEKWKLMDDGIWRARTLTAAYQWGEFAVEPADPKAVRIIENLYGEK
jgi:hypothetical protein